MELFLVFLELLIGFLFQGVHTNSEEIRGTPGVDYPTFYEIPVTSFRCSDQKYTPGFYADPETGCQVFHYCYNNRQESYLCPTGTIFNQAILACDYWYSSDCVGAASLYSVNNNYQSRVLDTNFSEDGTSGDFGIDVKPPSESVASEYYEALNAMPTEEDKNKLNQVISNLENMLPKKHGNETDAKQTLNIAENDNVQENDKGNADQELRRRLTNPTKDGDEETPVSNNTKAVDEYDRYPQSVASNGPASPLSTNTSGSVYEKLVDLQDTNSRLPKNENDREYTEEQLRGLIEEIRDYEHEMKSGRDKNYMFRPYYLEKHAEDDFSDLNVNEFNTKLTENANYDYSKINSEDGSDNLESEIEYDYDDSNANEDRLRYLHNLRVRDLHFEYSSNSKQDSTELNFNEGSSQQSELPNDAANTNEGSFEAPDDKEIFSKRQLVAEGKKNKLSRRDPIYVVPEVVNKAPKFLPKKKRQRGYPFGIQKTAVKNPTVTETNVGNITRNPAIEETEKKVISSSETPFDTASLNIYTDQTENWKVPSEEDYVSQTNYHEEIDVSQGNAHEPATYSGGLSDSQYRNSYVFEGNEYDLNELRDSEQGEWRYSDYPQNGFSDFEDQEHRGISRIEYLRGEERLPSDQEYESPLFETNKNIPESTQEYFYGGEYSGEGFDTVDYSNTLSQLNKNERNMYYPEVYSEKEDTNRDSEQLYQEELEKRIPTHSSDAYTNFNINRDAGNEKELGSLHKTDYKDEISGMDFENVQDQNDELTAEFDIYSSEQNDESSLRDEKDQSQDSENFSEYNFRNNPQNMYMDPEGNLFYYIDSEVTQSPENMYGVAPNDARVHLKNKNSFSDTDVGNTSMLKNNSFEDGQNSDSGILEDEPDSSMEESYSKNIQKMQQSDFNQFVTSQEFAETDISNVQYNEDDSITENDRAVPHFSTEEQNEYNDGTNEDSFQEEADPEETQKIPSGEDYDFRNYNQNIYRDSNGNMFYYADPEFPQGLESTDAETTNDPEFPVENMNSSGIGATDSDLLIGNAAEGGQHSDLHTFEREADEMSEETNVQNMMKMPDAEFNDYTNSQNIYTDSEGNMFYYSNTELPEDSENVAGNFNAMTSGPPGSDFSWKVTSVDGKTSPLSHSEDDQQFIDPEERYVYNIMKMSDTEIKEYLDSRLPEVNDIPDTHYSKYYAKNKRKPILANQDVPGFNNNMGDRFSLPVGEFNGTVRKWPNRYQLLESYEGISEKRFPDPYNDQGEYFSEETLQKRVETDFEEGLGEENNGFANTQNIYTDSSGNMFYYYPETVESEENLEDKPHTMASNVLNPDFPPHMIPIHPPENIFPGSPKPTEIDESLASLDEENAKKIMEMSDAEFKDYLKSQGLSQELSSYEQPNEDYSNSNEEGLQQDGSEAQKYEPENTFPGSPKPTETDDSLASLDEENAKKIMEMSDAEFKDYLKSQGLSQELSSYEQQNEDNSNKEGLQQDGSEAQEYEPEPGSPKPTETDISLASLDEENAKKIMEMSDAEFKDYLKSQGLSQELSSYEQQNEDNSNEEGLQQDGSEAQEYEPEPGSPKPTETDISLASLDEENAKKIMEMSDAEFKDYLKSQGLSQELSSYEQQNEDNTSSNEEGVQQDGSEVQDYDELAQEYDVGNNPRKIYVDSQGNMYYYAVDTEVSSDPGDFDGEAELNLESITNLNSNVSNLPQENEFTDSSSHASLDEENAKKIMEMSDAEFKDYLDSQGLSQELPSNEQQNEDNANNFSSDVPIENEMDPAAEEAYLQNIMKMSDQEFGVYLSSQELKKVTETPDVLSNENKLSGEQYSESQLSPMQNSITGFQPSNYETEKSFRNESYDSQAKGKYDSIQGINAFESGTQPLADTNGIHDSKTPEDASAMAANSASKQISEAAIESIDVNKDTQDELYGDFADIFAALAKDPEVKGQKTENNFKVESTIAEGKTSTGNAQEDVKSTNFQSSKLSSNEFDEQMPFKPLEQSSSVKGFGANSIPSNLKPSAGNQFSELPQFTQGFNSLQFQGVSPNQQYASSYSSQPVMKKSLPVQPKKVNYKPSQIREPTFGGTLRSMKTSKLQLLGLYANALRQRLF